MKTLTILFESPNVFYAVIDGVNIRIENPEIFAFKSICGWVGRNKNTTIYKSGMTYEIVVYEYSVNTCKCNTNTGNDCHYPICKVAILKLAKEEEPKETPNKRVKDHTSEWLKKYGNINKSEWNLALEAVIHNLKLRGFNEQDYNGKILFEEIEKLKK